MWAWIGVVAEAIWGAAQTAYDAIVASIVWSVKFLWALAIELYNGAISLGGLIQTGFKKAWDFLSTIYDDVLKPAWGKFWTLFDRFRTWLNATFGPVLKFLQAVRNDVLGFYHDWIRPVLDIIDAARGILRVLELLHIKFAAALDAYLGQLEALINKPFQELLSKLNLVVDFVNRIETADGLIQRVAHIRTLQRDILFATRVLTNSRTRALTDDEKYRIERGRMTPSIDALKPDLTSMWTGNGQSYTDDALRKVADVTAAYWA